MKNRTLFFIKRPLLILAVGGITFLGTNGCDNIEDLCGIDESNIATGEIFVTSLNHMVDIYTRIDETNKDSVLNATGTNTIDGAVCTKTVDSLIIDYGNSPTLCADGKTRSGSIRTKISGNYQTVGSQISASLENYFVNESQIKGAISVENFGPSLTPEFQLTTSKFMVDEDSEIDYSLQMNWLNGFVSPKLEDDIFDVSGSVSGTDLVHSKEFSSKILQPLHYVNECSNYIESGEMEITLVDDELVPTFTIDFIEEDGCNNLFQSTVNCNDQPVSFTYPFN